MTDRLTPEHEQRLQGLRDVDVDVDALLAELAAVRAERDAFCDRVDTLTAVAKGNKRHVREMFLELQKARARVEELEDRNGCLLDQQAKDDAEFAETLAERDRYRAAWQSARFRAQALAEGILRHVADRDTWKSWCKQAQQTGGAR
ncbi:hypothetical protein [Streptomyces sp. NPDC056817]|uniref:hypothetical protein n=1 Tax=Streptomyces sp. NPDC056817 TaxID=3345950 RepID=UPI003692D6B6